MMRGCLMAAPSKLEPVMKMPLHTRAQLSQQLDKWSQTAALRAAPHHEAPRMERPTHWPMPIVHQK